MTTAELGTRHSTWKAGAPRPIVQAAVAAGGTELLDRDALEPLVAELIAATLPPSQAGFAQVMSKRAARRFLDDLEGYPGQNWAQRWAAGDADGAGWTGRTAAMGSMPRSQARLAIDAVIVLGAIRPTPEWLVSASRPRLWTTWMSYHDVELFDRLRVLLQQGTPSVSVRVGTLMDLARMCIGARRALADLTAADYLVLR